MKAYRVTKAGSAPVLTDIPTPDPGPGEVRVDIAACGLNFADLLMIKGEYQQTPEAPFTLGMELAGVVSAQGPGVSTPAVGTRVAVMGGAGGLAEAGVFPAAACLPIPDEMPFEDAAAFQVAYGTSHLGLGRRARLASGETLLVLGAAGGVGLTAVEVGKLMGATVIACARGHDKLAVCKETGADHLVDSETDDIREAVKALGGADVVYDPVGGDQFSAAMRATNPEGRILSVGFASGNVPQIPANHLLVKNIDVIGYWWGGYAFFTPTAMRESMAELIGWYANGRLKPHIGLRLPLERASEAYEALRQRRTTGKVVVTTGDDQASL